MLFKREKLKYWVLFVLILIFITFLTWIIYFSVKETKDDNLDQEYFISDVIVDDFSNKTDSYLYISEGNTETYRFIDYIPSLDFFSVSSSNNYHFFQPYYNQDDRISFIWWSWGKGEKGQTSFYKVENKEDLNDLINSNLEYFAMFIEEGNSINHEMLYIPDSNYIIAIDNINYGSGKDNDDNGGLGDPSIQEIVFLDCNTGNFEIINISQLLNYDFNSWYYIDENNNYYRTIMPTNDFFHFNSIDFDGQNIYANSRSLGSIISIKVIDNNGNIMNQPEVNWIYSANYGGYFYYYEKDLDGDFPIIYSDNSDYYISNPEYDAQEIYDYKSQNNGLQKKFINWEINGIYYDASNLELLKNAQKENEQELFMGEHCVKLLNSYIEELGPEFFFTDPNYYDPNDLYFSMFDNHAEADDTSLEIHEESEYNYPKYEDDSNSYIKIIELNPTNQISKTNLAPMTARTIFNHPTEQKSNIISSCLFFNENNTNYVAVDQGRAKEDQKARLTIYQFDKIDPKIEDFSNYNIVYDALFREQYVYRAYPIWLKLNDDILISW
ncbi:MAG: hypothetical protein HPPSJP_3750 [Candidatus Hepatoplasma scabrum]|nr:MAG: hypothetical protein HPPSJP_3750 [Candidatus Hepatoplasma sp.]